MSKHAKSLKRLRTLPRDFTWEELVSVLQHFGYEEKSAGGGSGRNFINNSTKHKICLHKPHPENIVKIYAIKIAVSALIEAGLIEENVK